MSLRKYFLFSISIVSLLLLFLSNPSETNYLTRVSDDYAKHHHNMDLPTEILQHIGASHRTSYFLFSTYDYEFGNMKVFYFGIANSIHYLGIQTKKRESKPFKVV